MALPISTPDLSLLRPGVRVRLGGAKDEPAKPWPIGWQTVAEVEREKIRDIAHPIGFRVDSDERWLPVALIEEIALP